MSEATYRFPARLGGSICLDFSNTIEFRDSDRCLEFLHSYDHVLAWCQRSGLVESPEVARLREQADQRPDAADSAYHAALKLRDALYGIFMRVQVGRSPSAEDMQRLNRALTSTPRRIEAHSGGFGWAWVQSDDLMSILTPVAHAAAELLTSDQLRQVRQCPNCGWLFLDTSRNHSRRWCSMEICGSQVKSRRQYERRKTAKPE